MMNHNDHLSEVGVQKFYQRIADHHTLISNPRAIHYLALMDHPTLILKPPVEEPISPSIPDYHRCPKCLHPLVTCPGCSSVTCDNSWCAVGYLIKFLSSCQSCFSSLALSKKCNQDDCQSRAHLIGDLHPDKLCPDCVKPTDRVCPCGKTWVCGKCATDETMDVCGRCPKCRNYFCFDGCKYINVCPECKKTTLCNDCMELEDEDVHMSNEEGSSITNSWGTFITCESCRHGVCTDCFEEHTFHCRGCRRTCCRRSHSMPYFRPAFCLDCGAPLCVVCRHMLGRRRCFECNSSTNFRKSLNQCAATLDSDDIDVIC